MLHSLSLLQEHDMSENTTESTAEQQLRNAIESVAELVYDWTANKGMQTEGPEYQSRAKVLGIDLMVQEWKNAADMADLFDRIDREIDERCLSPQKVKELVRSKFLKLAIM
jgi:hypothetical protein